MGFADRLPDRDADGWAVEFAGWRALPAERRRLLQLAVADCGGRWREDAAYFHRREDALEAIGMLAGIATMLRIVARRCKGESAADSDA
jgi:hypothetical protein